MQRREGRANYHKASVATDLGCLLSATGTYDAHPVGDAAPGDGILDMIDPRFTRLPPRWLATIHRATSTCIETESWL